MIGRLYERERDLGVISKRETRHAAGVVPRMPAHWSTDQDVAMDCRRTHS
jgi:hypothetical protein